MVGCVGGNRLLTAEGIKEKGLSVRCGTSGEPIFTNGATTGAFSYLFNDAVHPDNDGVYSNDKLKTLTTRMDPVAGENLSRSTISGKIIGFVTDVLSVRTGGIGFERGAVYYEKIDTIVVERRWYESATQRALGVEQIGLPYEVRNMSGIPVRGYAYEGNGLYRRETLIINGISVEPAR